MKIATVTGYIGQDPRINTIGEKQTKLASFTVGSSGYVGQGKGDNGSNYETTWFKVNVWGQQADYVESNFKKGDSVEVVGEIRHSKFVTKDGDEQRSIEIKASHTKIIKKKEVEGNVAPVSVGDIPF